MPRPIRVGDNVRCLREEPGQFSVGTIYTVRWVSEFSLHVLMDDSGHENGWNLNFFELVEDEPEELIQEVVRYVVIYQYRGDSPIVVMGPQNYISDVKRDAEEGGAVILATKKLKFRVPIPVFPELDLDEDDNIIDEEEDEGNGF